MHYNNNCYVRCLEQPACQILNTYVAKSMDYFFKAVNGSKFVFDLFFPFTEHCSKKKKIKKSINGVISGIILNLLSPPKLLQNTLCAHCRYLYFLLQYTTSFYIASEENVAAI